MIAIVWDDEHRRWFLRDQHTGRVLSRHDKLHQAEAAVIAEHERREAMA